MTHPAGTIFVLRSGGFAGAVIRFGTRSRVNHAGIALGDGHTVEAQANGAIVGREQDNARVIWGTDLHTTLEAQRPGVGGEIARQARLLVGTPYGWLDIAALALACLGVRVHWLERIVDRQHALVCSQLVDAACLAAGVHLFADGRMPGRVSPGDLEWLIATGGPGVTVDKGNR